MVQIRYRKTTFFAMILLVCGTYGFPSTAPPLSDPKDDFLDALIKVAAKETLTTYGQGYCCYYDEEWRAYVYNSLDLMEFIEYDPEIVTKHTKELKDLAESVGDLCDSTKLLECGPDNSCICYNNRFWGIPLNSTYDKGSGSCNLSSGSICFPDESEFNIKCGLGTMCRHTKTRGLCTIESVALEIILEVDVTELTEAEIMRLIIKKFQDKVCQCM